MEVGGRVSPSIALWRGESSVGFTYEKKGKEKKIQPAVVSDPPPLRSNSSSAFQASGDDSEGGVSHRGRLEPGDTLKVEAAGAGPVVLDPNQRADQPLFRFFGYRRQSATRSRAGRGVGGSPGFRRGCRLLDQPMLFTMRPKPMRELVRKSVFWPTATYAAVLTGARLGHHDESHVRLFRRPDLGGTVYRRIRDHAANSVYGLEGAAHARCPDSRHRRDRTHGSTLCSPVTPAWRGSHASCSVGLL